MFGEKKRATVQAGSADQKQCVYRSSNNSDVLIVDNVRFLDREDTQNFTWEHKQSLMSRNTNTFKLERRLNRECRPQMKTYRKITMVLKIVKIKTFGIYYKNF